MSQTESFSKYDDLEKKNTLDILHIINEEDKKVPNSISKSLKSINTFIDEVFIGYLSFYVNVDIRLTKLFFST